MKPEDADAEDKSSSGGDVAVGKSTLVLVGVNEPVPEEFMPTVIDNVDHVMTVDGAPPLCLCIWDTAGSDDYDRCGC